MNNAPYQPPGAPPFRAEAPGKNFLLVAGILLIIFNAIGFFTTISTIATTNLWLWGFGGPAMRGTWMFIYSLNLLRSLFAVIVGIMGVTSCGKTEKGRTLFVLGIVFLVVTIIYSIVYNGLVMSFGVGVLLGIGGIIGIPLSLVIPIIFIIGASKNKKAAEAGGHHRGY